MFAQGYDDTDIAANDDPDLRETCSGLNGEDDLEDIQDYSFQHSEYDPFGSPIMEMLLRGFFHASTINFSEEKMKSVLTLVRCAIKLKEKDPSLKVPADDFVLNFHTRKKSRIPLMAPNMYIGHNLKTGLQHPYYLNKHSTYLKHLMADPVKSAMLSSFPDESTGGMDSLQQGEKWRTHKMFLFQLFFPCCSLPNG